MRKYLNGYKKAIIILHEIYGINDFIMDLCKYYSELGFDVYCPCLIHRKSFTYENANEAYIHFMNSSGFDVWRDINELVIKLKKSYSRVYIHGSSVGATIAWRCSQTGSADGVICCYGSRIRDYIDVEPLSNTLLIFAAKDSFDVDKTVIDLKGKENASIFTFEGHHGFMDKYGEYYDENSSYKAMQLINKFINGSLLIAN